MRCGKRALLPLVWCLCLLLKQPCWYETDNQRRAIDCIVRSLKNLSIDPYLV